MRMLALSIVIVAGALLAGAGAIAEAMAGARRYNDLDAFGLVLAGIGLVLFLIEWWTGLPHRRTATPGG